MIKITKYKRVLLILLSIVMLFTLIEFRVNAATIHIDSFKSLNYYNSAAEVPTTCYYNDGTYEGTLTLKSTYVNASGPQTVTYKSDWEPRQLEDLSIWDASTYTMNFDWQSPYYPDSKEVTVNGVTFTAYLRDPHEIGTAYTCYATPDWDYKRGTDEYPDEPWIGPENVVDGETYHTATHYELAWYEGTYTIDGTTYGGEYQGDVNPIGSTTPPDPSDPGGSSSGGGKIKFDPNSTTWTNKGKTGEGDGKYPVRVYYDGSNPYTAQGKATITTTTTSTSTTTNEDGSTSTTTTTTVSYSSTSFTVSWNLESISVSGAASGTISGKSGTVNIDKEGYHLQLQAEGHWGSAKYTLPSVDDNQSISVDYMPPNPSPPTGKSGYYNIDWTKPTLDFNIEDKIFSEDNGAKRKASTLGTGDSFYGILTEKDNLSGAKNIDYKWTYDNSRPSSGYTNLYTSSSTDTNKSSEVIKKEIEKPVGDHMYLHVVVRDIAGSNTGNDKNDTYECFGPFEDPIKLTNFQITDIRDPRWHSVFWNDDTFDNYKGVSFKSNQLPIDESSHPLIRNALPKKGYAFYWDITSEYLYREGDKIEVKPTFYYIKDEIKTRADAYYNNNNNPLVQFGTTQDDSRIYLNTAKYGNVLIGGLNDLVLTKGVRVVKGREWIGGWKNEIQYNDGKIQWWYGKYYIPSSTFFVKAGDKPLPQNKLTGGDMLINFDIVAYKNGVETLSTSQIFNYTTQQWEKEGGPKSATYSRGDTIIYNGKYGIDSDKTISVIH